MDLAEKSEEIMKSQSVLPPPGNGGSTVLRTCFNGINALSGIGILTIPYALSEGGWLSLIVLMVVAMICWYTGLLLRRCMDTDNCIQTYPDIGHRAFGYKGRVLVSLFMYLELYLAAVEFLILEGDNLDKLFPNMGFKVVGFKIAGKQGFVLLSALVILPTTWLHSLNTMAYFSASGVFASVILICCLIWTGTVDGVGFHEKGVLVNWASMPTAISMFIVCYGGHAVFPTLSTSMKEKCQFSKVLLVCFVTTTFIYGSMAVLGNLMYGYHLNSQVTLNLPIGNFSAKLAICTTLVHPLTKYAVFTSPIATGIEDLFHTHENRLISIFIRTLILITTTVVALILPFFGYVMAFMGGCFSVTVSILLPCLCYIRINKAATSFGLELVLIIVILIVGFFVGIIGTYTSIIQIVKHL